MKLVVVQETLAEVTPSESLETGHARGLSRTPRTVVRASSPTLASAVVPGIPPLRASPLAILLGSVVDPSHLSLKKRTPQMLVASDLPLKASANAVSPTEVTAASHLPPGAKLDPKVLVHLVVMVLSAPSALNALNDPSVPLLLPIRICSGVTGCVLMRPRSPPSLPRSPRRPRRLAQLLEADRV